MKTLYQNILSRDPDNEEVSHWTEFTRFFRIASTIGGIFTTDEFEAKQFPREAIVDKLYRSILSRECRGEEGLTRSSGLEMGLRYAPSLMTW